MAAYMHCRPCSDSHIPTCPCSFLFLHHNYILTSNYPTYTSPSSHDQAVPLSLAPRRRRRLEDPVITHASNYYATLPQQMSQLPQRASPSQSPVPPPLPPPRRVCQSPTRSTAYCDLFNLLERPSSPSSAVNKPRRKHNPNHVSSRRHHHHRPIESRNLPTKKVKNPNDQKSNYRRSSHYKENEHHQNDTLLPTERYDRSLEKTKKSNDIYQRHSTNKGFFRRVVCNYFCMPSTIANSGYSS